VEKGGSPTCKRIEPRWALALAACLALGAAFAAPAAAGGPNPDPAPTQARGPAPDPAPQATPTTARAVTQPASTQSASSTSQAAAASASQPPPAQQAVTPSHHQASVPAQAATHRRVARHVSPTPPPPSVLRRAGRALGALTFGRLSANVRRVDVPSAASSPDRGLLMLGGAILLLIVLGEVGFLSASVRLFRRAI
jgi:hypothetical protein